jgi:hypothetical protein
VNANDLTLEGDLRSPALVIVKKIDDTVYLLLTLHTVLSSLIHNVDVFIHPVLTIDNLKRCLLVDRRRAPSY